MHIYTTCVINHLKLLKLLHLTPVKHDLGWFRGDVLLKRYCFILWSAFWSCFQGCQSSNLQKIVQPLFWGQLFISQVFEILDQNILYFSTNHSCNFKHDLGYKIIKTNKTIWSIRRGKSSERNQLWPWYRLSSEVIMLKAKIITKHICLQNWIIKCHLKTRLHQNPLNWHHKVTITKTLLFTHRFIKT